MLSYEKALDGDLDYAFREGSMHFDSNSSVHHTMQKIAVRLDELKISYAVVGGMTMFAHGFRRFTEGVDILLSPEGLAAAHRQLDGLGYLPPFRGSKQLRDADTGVRIEFLVTGQFPGDGKPNPVAFPDPTEVAVTLKGIRFLKLEKLIELKLASGMTGGVPRMKDFTDVVELIKALNIPIEMAEKLDPYTRDKFRELWTGLKEGPAFDQALL